MADPNRIDPKSTTEPRSTDNEHTRRDKMSTTPEMDMAHDPRLHSARTDPKTGEVPAGGRANPGLNDTHGNNASSPTTGWSTKNIVIGLGVAVLVIVALMMIF